MIRIQTKKSPFVFPCCCWMQYSNVCPNTALSATHPYITVCLSSTLAVSASASLLSWTSKSSSLVFKRKKEKDQLREGCINQLMTVHWAKIMLLILKTFKLSGLFILDISILYLNLFSHMKLLTFFLSF